MAHERVVIDTNVFLSGLLSSTSTPARAVERAIREDQVLASKKTVEAKFVNPVPVFIVYFSVAALNDGSIVTYKDLYKRDGKVIAALNYVGGKDPTKKPVEKVATK